ncbi:MAG TPA: rod shape-determining protein MreC [Saprospiraceae bacterium]|nr:rod shape-determining protein MreC [Saprospiraceae bacterium]HND87645.1 rod shape-determining protein MreC [Saprospiraceae bacterium]
MGNLLQLFVRFGGFVTFVVVEAICFFVIVQNNTQKDAIMTHTWRLFSGSVSEKRQEWADYFGLNERVDSLMKENAALQSQLANARTFQMPYRDTQFAVLRDTLRKVDGSDSVVHKTTRPLYEFIAARVISNSITATNNWLMINRGSGDQVKSGMAVVSGRGIVGIARHVNSRFTSVMSVLHSQSRISAALKLDNGELPSGSILWEGGDPTQVTLRFIPKHFQEFVRIGTPVVTSGLSGIFPKSLPVGVVAEQPTLDPENPYFLNIRVRLSQDMSSVQDVFVVKNAFAAEMDSTQLKQRDER